MADTLTRVVRTIVLVKQDRAFHVDRRGTRWKMTELTWNLPGYVSYAQLTLPTPPDV